MEQKSSFSEQLKHLASKIKYKDDSEKQEKPNFQKKKTFKHSHKPNDNKNDSNKKHFKTKNFHKKYVKKDGNKKDVQISISKKKSSKRNLKPRGNNFSMLFYQHESRTYPYPKPLEKGAVRILPLGGSEEVGKNSTLIEYGDSMIIIDIGLQFPNEYMQGINYVIPDMNYVYKNKKKLKAVIITHGHYDHIGGIPHVMDNLPGIPLYSTPLTSALVKKRQDELGGKLKVLDVKPSDILKLGEFTVEFFSVNHSIPDCVAVVVKTPIGTIVHTGDWKDDRTPVGDKPMNWDRIKQIGQTHNVIALLADSTNAFKSGRQMSESTIGANLEEIFKNAKGRIITGTFASLLSRIQQIINISQKYGKKIVIEGRSMKTNVEIAKKLQFLKYDEKIFISINEAKKYPDNQIVITCTGAQGEDNAALMRIATNRHKHLEIQKGDTVVFSSSVVPGNEQSVQTLMDLIYRHGGYIYHYKQMDIHAGGHACADETVQMFNALRPKYFVPIEGNHFLLVLHAEIIEKAGMPRERIFIPDNGQSIEIYSDKTAKLTRTSTGNRLVAVDGLGVGDIGPMVLQERITMGNNGVFVLIFTVSKKTKRLLTNPDIISRGFVFMKAHEAMISEARKVALKSFQKHAEVIGDNDSTLKNAVRKDVENFIYKKLQREPMVLPAIIRV